MGGTETGEVEFDFNGTGDLVSVLAAQAGCRDIAGELDYPGQRESFAEAFLGLTRDLGGSVTVDAGEITGSQLPSAGYLIPKSRIHIRLTNASWQTALVLVPLIASIVATGGVLLPILAATPLLAILKETITRLAADDRLLVIVVAALEKSLGRAIRAAEVQEQLPPADRKSVADVQTSLERLAVAGVLEWAGDGFKVRF